MLHCCSRCDFFERKNKMKTKKHRLLALALISNFTLLGAASAAVQYPDGGVWTYG
ncbi:bacteriocin transporter, partial [Streptococcus pneumoniae]